jgi:hypothetical protein
MLYYISNVNTDKDKTINCGHEILSDYLLPPCACRIERWIEYITSCRSGPPRRCETSVNNAAASIAKKQQDDAAGAGKADLMAA